MAGSAKLAVLGAVYGVLSGDSTITTTYGAGVYQLPCDGSSLPYIGLEVNQELPEISTIGTEHRDVYVNVHTWTVLSESGGALAYNIDSRATALLARVTLSVSGWTFIYSDVENSFTLEEQSDGLRYVHVISTFKIQVQE